MLLYTLFCIFIFNGNINTFENENNIHCTKYILLKNYFNYGKLIIIQSITSTGYRGKGGNICKLNSFYMVYQYLQFIVIKIFLPKPI